MCDDRNAMTSLIQRSCTAFRYKKRETARDVKEKQRPIGYIVATTEIIRLRLKHRGRCDFQKFLYRLSTTDVIIYLHVQNICITISFREITRLYILIHASRFQLRVHALRQRFGGNDVSNEKYPLLSCPLL